MKEALVNDKEIRHHNLNNHYRLFVEEIFPLSRSAAVTARRAGRGPRRLGPRQERAGCCATALHLLPAMTIARIPRSMRQRRRRVVPMDENQVDDKRWSQSSWKRKRVFELLRRRQVFLLCVSIGKLVLWVLIKLLTRDD